MMAIVLWQTSDTLTESVSRQRAATEDAVLELVSRISRTALLTEEFSELKFYFSDVQRDPGVHRLLLSNAKGLVVGSADIVDLGQPMPEFLEVTDLTWRIKVIENATGTLGKLAIQFSTSDIRQAQADARRVGILLAAIGMTIIAIIGVVIGYLLTRRLDLLSLAATRMSEGDLSARVNFSGNDEVASVGRVFDEMAERLAKERNAMQRLTEELDARVIARTAELEAANKELEAFSYSISHDLRTPLRAICGFSQAMLDDYSGLLDDTGRDYLQRVCAGAQHMGILIDDMLKLAQVTRAKLDFKSVDLSELANVIVGQLCQIDEHRKVRIVIADGLQAYGDPGLLRAVLENLLGNAWKYTSRTENACITFDTVNHENGVAFRISDNGVGFDMKFADKLFGAFERLHYDDEFEGTGIGLATVARIINRHQGKIWAESEPGLGASFYFRLGAENEKYTLRSA